MAIYSKRQIAEMLGRPIRTITYWADAKIIHPDDPREARPGRARQFSKRNLIEFAMTDIMAKLGIEIETIKFIMDAIQPGAMIENFFDDPKWGKSREVLYFEFIDRDGKTRSLNPVKSKND